jgi:hypothetical protein
MREHDDGLNFEVCMSKTVFYWTMLMAGLVLASGEGMGKKRTRDAVGMPSTASPLPAVGAPVQTIVFLRHGEKPERGLGQLTCQGLNRALALPAVIEQRFGRPAAIFAPNPSAAKPDNGEMYSYVRPLATIEPTAIALGMPVNTQFGYDDVAGVTAELGKPAYATATVLVAWEHRLIEDLAKRLLADRNSDESVVPKWNGKDFDSFYVVRIDHRVSPEVVTFEVQHQGLDNQPTRCPSPAH